MNIQEIPQREAEAFISKHHYSKVMPRLTNIIIGGFQNHKLVAVITLGWGVKPLHTIRKLFPSLKSQDYLEIGKLCLTDEMPKNSESTFLAMVIKYLKLRSPQLKLLFTWSDGMLGKVGYVYQASNFLYGGFIWTDSYFSKNGTKIHPRSTKELCTANAKMAGKKRLFWLTDDFQEKAGIKRYKGKQFRYLYFLCSRSDTKQLLAESKVKWTRKYPKHNDLEWKTKINGKYEICPQPFYKSSIDAEEVSRGETLACQAEGRGAIPLLRTTQAKLG